MTFTIFINKIVNVASALLAVAFRLAVVIVIYHFLESPSFPLLNLAQQCKKPENTL